MSENPQTRYLPPPEQIHGYCLSETTRQLEAQLGNDMKVLLVQTSLGVDVLVGPWTYARAEEPRLVLQAPVLTCESTRPAWSKVKFLDQRHDFVDDAKTALEGLRVMWANLSEPQQHRSPIAGAVHKAYQALSDRLDREPPNREIRTCRECGCTQDRACTSLCASVCWWVEVDLCSACAPQSTWSVVSAWDSLLGGSVTCVKNATKHVTEGAR